MRELINVIDVEGRYTQLRDTVESFEIVDDAGYIKVCDLAKAIGTAEKDLKKTHEAEALAELKEQEKPLAAKIRGVADKLKELKRLCRTHIGAYAVRRSQEVIDDATERALMAAIATGDESFLDILPVSPKAVPNVAGIVFRSKERVVVTDESVIPEEFFTLTLNMRMVEAAAKAGVPIPGVRLTKSTEVAVRA